VKAKGNFSIFERLQIPPYWVGLRNPLICDSSSPRESFIFGHVKLLGTAWVLRCGLISKAGNSEFGCEKLFPMLWDCPARSRSIIHLPLLLKLDRRSPGSFTRVSNSFCWSLISSWAITKVGRTQPIKALDRTIRKNVSFKDWFIFEGNIKPSHAESLLNS